jgi:hypothetical protein
VRRTREGARSLSVVDILEPLTGEELEELAARCSDVPLEREDFYRPTNTTGDCSWSRRGACGSTS